MGAIKRLAKFDISVEEVFEVKHGTVASGIAGERADKFRMCIINRLESFALVLYGGPSVA
jgi:hypothetical protein